MQSDIARHVPRPDRGHFEEMTTREAARCTAACARTGRRCPRQWACVPRNREGEGLKRETVNATAEGANATAGIRIPDPRRISRAERRSGLRRGLDARV